MSLLLSRTVMREDGAVRLFYRDNSREKATLSGWESRLRPVPLNDGRFLRLAASLYLDPSDDFLKVETSSYQYQIDEEGERVVFRYDYLREPGHHHPPAHLQVAGRLAEPDVLPAGTPLERVHFPVGRASIEAVIRLLAEEFEVPCNEEPEVWRPLLAETERRWLRVAHVPLSGPGE